jgi:5'-nucleotidase
MSNKKIKKTKEKKPLILVVNDDGIDAKGIRALGEVAQEFGRVVMIAPSSGRSGMSHAITFASPLRLRRLHYSDDFEIYKTNGTPVDAVKLALRHLLKDQQVDLLVSGINQGANTSVSVFYSATVAAAVEGCLCGIPSIAFSLANYTKNADFESAKMAARKIIPIVLKKGLPPQICLNVNIPNIAAQDVKGIKITRQAKNYWHEDLDARKDPGNNPYFWMSGSLKEIDKKRDTDMWAIKHNYISVHPLKTDWTDNEMIQELKNWKIK